MTIPTDHEAFYAELVSRNRGLIAQRDQSVLRGARIVLAGCGSTGGACVMPLLRSGAENLVLLDPGDYELNNLNRQDATLVDVGRNKAEATADRVRQVNPFAQCRVHAEGVTLENATMIVHGAAIVIDAVDVTTASGVRAKYALHRSACSARVPVLTAYDIAGTQFLEIYDYRRLRTPLRGRMDRDANPDVALRKLIPPWVLPREIFPVLVERHRDPELGFPQLVMTSTLLGALIVPYTLRVLRGDRVATRMRFDLNSAVRPWRERPRELAGRTWGLVRLLKELR